MDGAGELKDWELLQNSVVGIVSSGKDASPNCGEFEGVDGDSEGVVQSDYFALDSDKRQARLFVGRDYEEGSTDSDNPSWIDPGSEPRYGDDGKTVVGLGGVELPLGKSIGFWSDSSSDESMEGKVGGLDRKADMGRGGYDGSDIYNRGSLDFWSSSGVFSYENCFRFDGTAPEHQIIEGGQLAFDDHSKASDKPESSASGGITEEDRSRVEHDSPGDLENASDAERANPSEGGKKMVWWKLPFELLKFYTFRIGPVWSISIAVAAMGLLILGRKLYKMKRRTRSFPLNFSVDDKVSRFKIQAARLNEAFTVVKRVPVMRLPLPMPGAVTPWPVLGLR